MFHLKVLAFLEDYDWEGGYPMITTRLLMPGPRQASGRNFFSGWNT